MNEVTKWLIDNVEKWSISGVSIANGEDCDTGYSALCSGKHNEVELTLGQTKIKVNIIKFGANFDNLGMRTK